MRTPHRSSIVSALFALLVAASALSGLLFQPPSAAAETALAELPVLAGPSWDFAPVTVAPAGAWLRVDGEAVDGFLPVTFEGVSGWADAAMVGPDGAVPAQEAAPAEAAPATDGGTWSEAVVAEEPVFSEPAPEAAPAEAAPAAAAPAAAAPAEAPPTGAAPTNSGDDLVPPAGDSTRHEGQSSYSEDEIIGIIREAAATHGQSAEAMIRVARCESGLNPSAIGGGGAYYGLFQFVPSTFERTPYGDGDIFDPWANANAAGWMWAQGRKNEWVCQ